MSPARKRAWGWGLVALLVAGAAAGWALLGPASASTDEAAWLPLTRGDLVVGLETTGTLRAERSIQLGPPQVQHMWNFKIAFLAPEGTSVAPGMPVMRFDTTDLERRLIDRASDADSAAKQLERLETDLAKRRSDAELQLAEARARERKLALKVSVPEELTSAKELKEAQIDLDVARAEVRYLEERFELEAKSGQAQMQGLESRQRQAANRVREIEKDLERLTVKAPAAGTVIYVSDRGGGKKKIGDTVWRQAKVLEIPDLTEMVAEGEVDEADAGRLEVGQRVTLRLDAQADLELTGRIRRVGRTVQRRSRASPIKVVRIEIQLDETDPQTMRPGMRFRGTVEVERLESVLLLPAEAVELTADGARVRRQTRWGDEIVYPSLGRRGENGVEVLSGLREGDRVLRRGGEGS